MKKGEVFVLIAIWIFAIGLIVIGNITGNVSLDVKENYGLNSALSGEVNVIIEQGDSIQKDTLILLQLKKDGNVLEEKEISFFDFLSPLEPTESSVTEEVL